MSASSRIERAALPLVLGGAVLAACGGEKASKPPAPDDAALPREEAPLAMPQLGVDHVQRMNFVYGDGKRAYDKALGLLRDEQLDAARAQAETALAKDPGHLDAHYLLARLLARSGEHAAAVHHLVTALAGDYYQYGPAYASEADLAEFRETSHGHAVTTLAARIQTEYGRRVSGALWFLGRRSTFKWPKGSGVAPASTRGELYAYDPGDKRFYRLTHTDHRVLAYVRANADSEIALVGFHQIERPRAPASSDAPVTLTKAWVQLVDATTWQARGKRIALPAAHEIAIGYREGDQLVIATRPTSGEPSVFVVDRAAGKLVASTLALPVPRLSLTLEEGHAVRATDGVTATWTGEPPSAPVLATRAGGTITAPESGLAAQGSLAVSPDGARIAFATAVDPCNQDVAPSLYVADARTGGLRHVFTSRSRFVPQWLDANRFAYEDGEGAIRVWDAAAGRQAFKIENTYGLGLEMLSLSPARRCIDKPEPAAPEAPGAGPAANGSEDDEPPMPPEEPVTMPR